MISTHLDAQDLVETSDHSKRYLNNVDNDAVTIMEDRELNLGLAGVVAGNTIPTGVFVSLGSTNIGLGHDLLHMQQSQPMTVSVGSIKVYWKNGHLETTSGESASSWIHSMKSARDRHEQNVELLRGESGLYARTIRQIERGEMLLAWYGEGLAREVGVPILTPCHIRGHQEYVCSGCHAGFTHPNTLKAHMLLRCTQNNVRSVENELSLVPFHRLLQTISKASVSSTAAITGNTSLKINDGKSHQRSSSSSLSSASTRQSCLDCDKKVEDTSYRSAFRTLARPRDTKKSEDTLMTPDSSTDQNSALNLTVKPSMKCNMASQSNDIPNAVHPWNAFAAHQMLSQQVTLPFDYSPLTNCYPITPHFHPLGLHLMNCGQPSLPQDHPYRALLDRSAYRGQYHLQAPPCEDTQDHTSVSNTKPHSSEVSPPMRHPRTNNSYGFALPSDKEPLDLLPQAYFANKSKKGHLCLCCGKLYSRKYGLKIHMRTHNGYKPLKCKICSRPFGDPSNLNKHVRLHAQGETPYRCEYCGKVLVRRRDLERHVRSRHPTGNAQSVEDSLVLCESSPDSSPASISSLRNASPENLLSSQEKT